MMIERYEYIWLDGSKPTAFIRSKTKIVRSNREVFERSPGRGFAKMIDVGKMIDGPSPPVWGFDGSSTNQAEGSTSDCVLIPVCTVGTFVREGVETSLVLCEVNTPDGQPHPTNTRALLREVVEKYEEHECLFGFEQEYTLMKDGRPLGFPEGRLHYPRPQGPYYCGVGAENSFGREIVEIHLSACIRCNLAIEGINAEVMPGQWEYQIGAKDALMVSDQLILARWLLAEIGESFDIEVSRDSKPVSGDWNGAGCHTNFSTKAMRGEVDGVSGWEAIQAACKVLGEHHPTHISLYGDGIEDRLTGEHETCKYDEYRYGVSDRGASVRIPWQVARDKKGYIEDRRPNANCDPYVVSRLLIETICGGATASYSPSMGSLFFGDKAVG